MLYSLIEFNNIIIKQMFREKSEVHFIDTFFSHRNKCSLNFVESNQFEIDSRVYNCRPSLMNLQFFH